ncbi:hypothetical protein NRIC_25430 [Enterococcus florum]|uniref:Uncharacterized protein n=1 Tax=Enterococcus florum TaxID=2480627 RepID=A0A4P5PG76_9ENTE|nr:hypothetical protein NRIC_25430 [Enterococcus florum]
MNQLIKLNSGKYIKPFVSLEEKIAQIIEVRFQNFQLSRRSFEQKEIKILCQIISRTLFTSAKRQETDYLYLLKSMVHSYLEFKIQNNEEIKND